MTNGEMIEKTIEKKQPFALSILRRGSTIYQSRE